MDARLSCEDLMRRTSEYLDEALPPGEREAFDGHLATCAARTRHLQGILQTIQGLQALPREPMPSEMKERLRQALHSRLSA
ncbi:MAG TPA: zf-HC2 domain-containing protein [Longimicrobium sp.]|nr:zf-HC2 domain-containing protein [Longimicrobium sp.]